MQKFSPIFQAASPCRVWSWDGLWWHWEIWWCPSLLPGNGGAPPGKAHLHIRAEYWMPGTDQGNLVGQWQQHQGSDGHKYVKRARKDLFPPPLCWWQCSSCGLSPTAPAQPSTQTSGIHTDVRQRWPLVQWDPGRRQQQRAQRWLSQTGLLRVWRKNKWRRQGK